MVRAINNTVEYFPHHCECKHTFQKVLFKRYQANGHSLYWQLFELLGKAENHYYDLRNEDDYECFIEDLWCEGNLVEEILDFLAKRDVINKYLWEKKIIWSQEFVNKANKVYEKRKRTAPDFQDIKRILSINEAEKVISVPSCSNLVQADPEKNATPHFCAKLVQADPEIPQSKVKVKVKDKVKDKDIRQSEDRRVSVKKDYSKYLEYWNSSIIGTKLPKVLKLTDGKIQKIKTRERKDPNFFLDFKRCVDICIKTPFLRGEIKPWRATFDFIIKNDDNYERIASGGYGEEVKTQEEINRESEIKENIEIERLTKLYTKK